MKKFPGIEKTRDILVDLNNKKITLPRINLMLKMSRVIFNKNNLFFSAKYI
jgi:hypothetical protein